MDHAPLVHLYSGEQYWPCDIAEHLHHITPTLNYTPLQAEQRHPTLQNLNELNEWNHGKFIYLTSNDDVEKMPEWLLGEKNIPYDPYAPNDPFEDNDGWVHKPGRTCSQSLEDIAANIHDRIAPGDENPLDRDDWRVSKPENSETEHNENPRFQGSYCDESRKSNIHDKPVQRMRGGRSDAPAVLIVVNKGHGIIDAFWFFFYSFNLGNVVFNVRFGNHVGDWEHTAIRFHHGEPKAVFFSEHNFGSAYGYEAVEKYGKRPVIYSAVGTHAMYATSGNHPYVLPWGILHDQTDEGPLWDPALNAHTYTYDFKNDALRSSNFTPEAPVEWFHFAGHWGDKIYPLSDKRQYRFAGQYHYVTGPLGPRFKNLGRKKICGGPDSARCVIKHWLSGSDRISRWQGFEEDGEGSLE